MRIYCTDGEGGVFHVDIDKDQSVGDLKEAIANILKTVNLLDLRLFLATKKTAEGDKKTWMTECDVLGGVRGLSDDNCLKFYRAKLKDVGLASDQLGDVTDEAAAAGLAPVHVVAKFAEEQFVPRVRSEIEGQKSMKRLKTTEVDKWEWKEEEPVYSRDRRLFFVNREKAVKDLVKFHQANFNRAKERSGGLWVIPLLDNMFGVGKSAFGQEYIRRCQSLKPDTTSDEFMTTLCSCHTIRITLGQEHVLDKNGDFDYYLASRSLVECLRAFFTGNYDVLPRAFDNIEDGFLLTKLTEEVGPLCIVIDEIGLTFHHNKLDDAARRERFFEFCTMLQPLFHNRKLFFLIAGRASFLNHVARRPLGNDSLANSSAFKYERLHLHFLPPEAIKTVIENTRWEETSSESIQTHLELTDNQVVNLSARLAGTTFGHPRSLWEAFGTCESYDELFNYVPEPLEGVDWNRFFGDLRRYRSPLKYLMECALVRQEIDLSAPWIDAGGMELTYEEIVSAFGIKWEGGMENALLYMPAYIQKPILTGVFTVKELLEKVVPVISHLSIDYPDVFEMLCLNRFQEMFPSEGCPHEVLPSFFTKKQRFGRCRGVQFADRSFQAPEITKHSKHKSSSLASKTVHSDKANIEMAEADEICERTSHLNLKSRPLSESTVIFSTKVQGMVLTVGFAVKIYSTVTAALVDEEREKFDSLLSKKNGCLNVLFIYATRYGGNLQEAIGSAKSIIYTEAMQSTEKKATTQYIHEVILLDLSTPQNRAEYFGLAWNGDLHTCLEKVIHKAEVRNSAE
ncbi:hypothetical protein DVH05_016583 [Phytophthora capsici]|nr:hypothetical protein DVH05_016583 [Phytophthora capsici]